MRGKTLPKNCLTPIIDRVFAIGEAILRGIETRHNRRKVEGTLPESLPPKEIDLEFIMEATDLSKERLLELNS